MPTEPRCQLYLVADVAAGEPVADRLAAALSAAPVACVLLRGPAGGFADRSELKALVAQVQASGVAALVEDDARLAADLRADGVHLATLAVEEAGAAYAVARQALGPAAIVGVTAGGSRHAAMVLAELGADYVAFPPIEATETAEPENDDAVPAGDQLELVHWWAELFEIPCVAWDIADAETAAVFAAAGADFVATNLPSAPAISLARMAEAIA